jgi:hypothetical protein
MTLPFIPTPIANPVMNPAIGWTGARPIPYISNSQFQFAPTALTTKDLVPGGDAAAQAQSLANTIRRATGIINRMCFGASASSKGGSLAASLVVDSARIRIKGGELRLICDYTPLVQLVGVAVGAGMSSLSDLAPALIAQASPGRKTWTIPYGGLGAVFRGGDSPAYVPAPGSAGSVYTVWSYINGYPHTALAANVAADATSCVVKATDGNGGLWAVIAASGSFPGTGLQIVDNEFTEEVSVLAIIPNTPSVGLTTLTTTPFEYAHTVPSTGPDFIPVTAVPDDVHQATISVVEFLIKTRGARGLSLPSTAGGKPGPQSKKGQAGVFADYETALNILGDGGYVVRLRHPGSY